MLIFKRLFFAFKNYKFLKTRWGIKYPIINAIFGDKSGNIYKNTI